MNFYSIKDIAEIINGEILNANNKGIEIKNISIDSRTITRGKETVFFAIISRRNDGHKYIDSLVQKGVSLFVVSKLIKNFDQFTESTFIKVDNTLEALQKLTSFHRSKFQYPVIGITGSNGKTIVKEWLYDLLIGHFSIIRSPKSYNSQVGVPLSVWLMNNNYNLAIFEAGISFANEMDNLEKIISPEIGVFTNIGSAHQENFKSIQQKVNEKLKLFKKSKKLIYSTDQKDSTDIISDFCDANNIKKINWSINGNPATIQFSTLQKNSSTILTAIYKNKIYSFSIGFTNYSAIENACHCFATALTLKIPPEKILDNFSWLTTIPMRLEIKKGKNNCLLINDYYNSDINALSIALSALNSQSQKGHLSKTLIISDIKQSGLPSHKLYKLVNDMAVESGVNRIIGIGPDLKQNSNYISLHQMMYSSTTDFLNHFNFSTLKDSAILLKGAREFNFELISAVLQEKAHQTVLQIDMNALVENLNTFKGMLKPSVKVMAMVKAFSYGSGDIEIARLLQYHGVDYLAVAVADEGVELRKSGITSPIVVMNPEPFSFSIMFDYNLEPNIYNLELLKEFNKAVHYNALIDYPVHLKIDSGMNRLGFKSEKEIEDLISIIKGSDNIKIQSVFSHLAASNEPVYDDFTRSQINRFDFLSSGIISNFNYKIDRHILNSAGIERFNDFQFDMVRLGIGLYGISATETKLNNISTLKTTISQIKEVQQNETVGYNRKGEVLKLSKIAVIPVGYGDGLKRSLGNLNGRVFINGYYAPIIGSICMDMCMLDVTNLDVKTGDEVEIFGENIAITELAEKTGTIPYEVFTGISQRVKRIYIQE